MAMAKDKSRIHKIGIEVEGSLDGGTVWDHFGHLKDFKFSDAPDAEDGHDSVGDLVAVTEGNQNVKVTGVLMQTTKDEIDYVRNNRFKTILLRGKGQRSSDAKWEAWAFGESVIRSGVDLGFGPAQRSLPFEASLFKGETTGKYYDFNEAVAEPTVPGDWPTVN